MYRVILTKNGEYKKTLHRCKTRDTSFINFRRIKEENESIVFPRKYVNYNGIFSIEYKIYIVKDTEEGDKFRIVRDEYGKLYEEEPIFGIWTILDSSVYDIEETFWIFGRDAKTDRATIHDVLPLLMKNIGKKNLSKQIIVVHNKLVIYNEEQFDMVICKCLEDAQRLHHALAKAAKKNKIKGLLFMGTATPASISRMYEIIKDHTKWPLKKIRRTTTRP